jgi:AAA domain
MSIHQLHHEQNASKHRFATRDPFDLGDDEEHVYVIEDILPARGVLPMVAAQESFKSFVAIDLGFHVATGREWYGHPVKQGTVVYIVAEDELGHRKRRKAWGIENGFDGDNTVPFRVIEASPYLGSVVGGEVKDLIQIIEAEGLQPVLIVCDTLNQGLQDADEDGAGMQAYMSNATALARHFGCVVMPIHHPGHRRADRGRGGSSFGANSDNSILMKRMGRSKGLLTTFLELKKGRNEADSDMGLLITLRSIELPLVKRGGAPVTTLVVDSVAKAPKPKSQDGAGKPQAKPQATPKPEPEPKGPTATDNVLEALEGLTRAAADGAVTVSDWSTEARARMQGKSNSKSQAFTRAREAGRNRQGAH